ncbi:MAG: hypothetical protein NVSMB27_19690 [Ktedonobacteraceae bacterium]
MKKIRYSIAAIALLTVLSGPLLQGAGSIANTAASRHASTALAVAQLTRSHVFKFDPPCPIPGQQDC